MPLLLTTNIIVSILEILKLKYYLHLVGGEECGGVVGAPQVPDRQHPVLAPGHQDVGLRGVG